MKREDHQPQTNPVVRQKHSAKEMRTLFGHTIAFIMAFGLSSNENSHDITTAIEAATHVHMAAVFVLGKAEYLENVIAAMHKDKCQDSALDTLDTTVKAIDYDPASAIAATHHAGDFELFSLPFGLIETARTIAETALNDYREIIIMDGCMNRITAEHLYEMCLDAQQHDIDVAVSWIQQLRRPPVLLTRVFLDNLQTADYINPTGSSKIHAVPRIRTLDHLFGEEILAAKSSTPHKVSSFLDECTITALEAVHFAQDILQHVPEVFQVQQSLSNADLQLIKIARKVITTGNTLTACIPNENAELSWANAFGQIHKRDFPLLNTQEHCNKLAYLDTAATSQRVNAALQAQNHFDTHDNANVYRGAYRLSTNATAKLNNARAQLEEFIGAKRRETIYTCNTTASANLVALSWGEWNIRAGDLIICCQADHHSNTLPFLMLAQRKNAQVEYVPFNADGRLDLNAYTRLLEKHPKLVCLTQIGNVFGIEAPIKEMTFAAHAVGARVFLDAAQSFPHLKIDVDNLGIDWLACSAHKAYASFGIGALWISPHAFAEMDPLCGGGGVVSHAAEQSYYLRPLAPQYEPGTPPISQAIGWAAAIDYLSSIGMNNIARHDAVLTRYATQGLQQIDGVHIMGDHTKADGQNGLISFTLRSVSPGNIAHFLGKLGVAIRAGGHCAIPLHATLGVIGTGRISIAVHTTRDDIDAALTSLTLCRHLYES